MSDGKKSITAWPFTESDLPHTPDKTNDEWLDFVITQFEQNDGLADGIDYKTEITESVTVEELLGALEVAREYKMNNE